MGPAVRSGPGRIAPGPGLAIVGKPACLTLMRPGPHRGPIASNLREGHGWPWRSSPYIHASLGHEAVGTVDAVGTGVKTVTVGDRVLVSCVTSCGT